MPASPSDSPSLVPKEYPMLSVEECIDRINQVRVPFHQDLCARQTSLPCESLKISSALGRILAADVRACRSVPPCPTSIMDGFAVVAVKESHESIHRDEAAPYRQLHVASKVTAGHGVATVDDYHSAAYVTTGTQLASKDYAVVKIEDCELSDGTVRVPVEGVCAGLNIRQVGSDMAEGTVVAPRGTAITPTLLALLRDVAREVELMPVLKVAVVSSGDELLTGETVDTNGPMLEGMLYERFGAAVKIERAPPLVDDFDKERDSLLALADTCDVVISTGAVSKGSKDFIKKILEQEGELHFAEVCLKPGKPTTFATLHQTPFFALPGNPASAYVTFHLFVAPFIEASLTGREARGDITVTLADDFHQTDPVRPELVRANVSATREGHLVARGVSGGCCQRSSRLFSCVDVNALVKLPAGAGRVARGTRVPCILTGLIRPSMGEEASASTSDVEAEAFAFRKLVGWLQDGTDVQNIDLMNLAGFCRNCLSKWYAEGASIELEDARERVYGMPYAEWKHLYQTPASEEAKAKFAQVHNGDNRARTACGHATGPPIPRHHQHVPRHSDVSIGVVTCSDRASQGVYKDEAGTLVAKLCGNPDAPVIVVPDDMGAIQNAISDLQNRLSCQLIITTGGTGFSDRDVTPEAVSAMLAKRATGLEHMLLSCGGRDRSKSGMFTFLSRPVAGVLRGQPPSVVVTLPGSPRAVQEILGNEELVAVLIEAARMASTKTV